VDLFRRLVAVAELVRLAGRCLRLEELRVPAVGHLVTLDEKRRQLRPNQPRDPLGEAEG
jgi:hypothetical protein